MRRFAHHRMFRVRYSLPSGLLPIIIAVTVAVLSIRGLSLRMEPIVRTIAESKTINLISLAISEEVNNCLESEQLAYHDFVSLGTGDEGQVTTLAFKSGEGSRFKRTLTERLVDRLENIDPNLLGVPLGTLTGFIFFSSFGPDIRVRIQSVGDVSAEYRNEFVSTGVNQTKHSVYLDLCVTVYLLIPGEIIPVTTNEQICVAETIIVGEVPDTYLNLQNGAN